MQRPITNALLDGPGSEVAMMSGIISSMIHLQNIMGDLENKYAHCNLKW